MRKMNSLSRLICTMLMFYLSTSALWAATNVTVGGLKYQIDTSAGTAIVMGISSTSGSDLTIPGSIVYNNSTYKVTTINTRAFRSVALTGTLKIEDGVTTIRDEAFQGSKFDAIILPATLSTIGADAFDMYYSNLRYVRCYRTTPPKPIKTGYEFFQNSLRLNTPLQVPKSALSNYKSVWEWSGFKTITEIPADPTSVKLDRTDAMIEVGESLKLTATILPTSTSDTNIVWTTSDASVATVSETGLVTAVKVGTTIVTATAGKFSASCTVTVRQPATGVNIDFAASGIESDDLTLKVGETKTIKVNVTPATSTDKLSWSSSNPKVASVDGSGKITAVKPGETVVSVTTESGKSASIKVTVVQLAESVVIDKNALGITGNNLDMRVGDVKTIQVTVLPETTTDKSVTFTSSKPAVASVDQNGTLKALSLGTTTITVKAASGVSTTLNITVVPTPAASIKLNKTEATLKATETVQLTATIAPETTTDKTVTWTTSDASVATVSETGLVTAVKVGTATITATAASGVKAECAITVAETPAGQVTIDFAAMGIDGDALEMRVGETKGIKVTVSPATTTDKTVTYESANSAIATVDAEGNVTAVAVGETTIKVTAKSGVSATLNVTVIAPLATSISLDKTVITTTPGSEIQLTATVLPEEAAEQELVWTSSNEAIATVSAEGLVSILTTGQATITEI